MYWLLTYWLSVPNSSWFLLHENRFWPFKYFSLPTGNLSLEGTGITRQEEKVFASWFRRACWASSPGSMISPSTRFQPCLVASSTQQPVAFPGTNPRQFCNKVPPVRHLFMNTIAGSPEGRFPAHSTRMSPIATSLPIPEPEQSPLHGLVLGKGSLSPGDFCSRGNGYFLYLQILYSLEFSFLLAT